MVPGLAKAAKLRFFALGTSPANSPASSLSSINRRERFRREVEAIKRLTDPATHQAHPNVISLIDHSALDEAGAAEKECLVMPIAQGGELSVPGRLGL